MTVTDSRNFLGIPIEGDITYGAMPAEQYPKEQLAPLLSDLLNAPGVEAVRWVGYTPYFNDGEPCVFGVSGVRVLLSDQAVEELNTEYEDGYLTKYDDALSGGRHYDRETGEFVQDTPPHPIYEVYESFRRAVEGGHFDHALLELFGDHAQVTVTREKIEVEFYDHD